MKPKPSQSRRRPLFRIEVEGLETRQLMTGGAGNTFALETGTIAAAGGTASIPFTISSSQFTKPRSGKIEVGFDIVNNNSSTLDPVLVSISKASGGVVAENANLKQTVKLEKSTATQGEISKAMIVSLPAPKKGQTSVKYDLNIAGLNGTSGDYLTGFYLVGDADGDGVVSKADIGTIKKEVGQTVSGTTYTFDADSNRDGKITQADVALAMKNLGAKTTITPDLTANLDPTTDTSNGNRITNDQTVHFTGVVAPGATVTYHEINNLTPDVTTTADSSGNYSVMIPLGLGTNTFQVTGLDAFGQTIQGDIQPVTYTTGPVTQATTATTTS